MKGQQLNASIIAQTRLTSTEEFGKILLKVNQDGSRYCCVMWRRLSWVVRTTIIAEFNGQPASGLGIKLASANALDTAAAIRAELAKTNRSSRRV